jgi:hypothetical protein
VYNVNIYNNSFLYKLHAYCANQIEKNIWVSCMEMENFNVTLEYDTHIGFPTYYFPYANQNGYLSPFVAMQIDNLPGRMNKIFRKMFMLNNYFYFYFTLISGHYS